MRSSGAIARLGLAALCCCSWFAAPKESAAEGPPPSTEEAGSDAVLVGSSSFNQGFGRLIERELAQRGYRVTRKGVSGSGLARPDFCDMQQALETLPIGTNTAAVLIYLGVNDAQPLWLHPHERSAPGASTLPFGTAAWDSAYEARAREFYERICQRGARHAIVLLPIDVNRPALQQQLEHIRDLQVQAAGQTSCAVALSTAGDAGNFEVAGQPKRAPDGYHMSNLGAQIVWSRVEARVLELIEAAAR